MWQLKRYNIVYPRKYGFALFITLLFAVCAAYWQYSSSYLGMLSIPFTLIGLWGLVPSKKWPRFITRSAFPMFLTHQMFFMFIPKSAIEYMVGDFGLYIALCLSAILASIVLAVIVRMLPWSFLADIAFGGRL